MNRKIIVKILFFANLTVAGIVISLTIIKPINYSFILTGIGALFATILCARFIMKYNNKTK